jgi:predicted RNase H-like HicB family nuclease
MSSNAQYAVVIEQADDGSFSAYVPDLPGCVACGDTVDEVRGLIAEAVRLHIESLKSHGEAVPPARTRVDTVRAA